MSLGNDVAKDIIRRNPELAGTLIEELGTIVSTACLAHDMGNPPFGHSGEKALQTFFTEGKGKELKPLLNRDFWDDITHFEGNANAFRLLTHRFCGRRKGGFVMTYTMLASIVKYPFSSSCAGNHGKFGFFNSEAGYFRRVAEELGMKRLSDEGEPLKYARHPLVYLVEAADDICYEIMDIEDAHKLICYEIMDIEDAHKLKILTFEETKQLLLGFFEEEIQKSIIKRITDEELTDENEQVVYMRACAIGKLENVCAEAFLKHEQEILDGTFQGELIDYVTDREREAYKRCTETAYKKIYHSKPVIDIELAGYRIINTLMEQMTEAAASSTPLWSR